MAESPHTLTLSPRGERENKGKDFLANGITFMPAEVLRTGGKAS
jgi:hypothetical protein